jgi:DNA ligase-1
MLNRREQDMGHEIGLTRRALLAGLGIGWAGAGLARSASAPPPAVLLARDAPDGVDPAGYLVSEKFDGVRAVWDGHTLRFRSGLPVTAPHWFVERLPGTPLDGELWFARGRFEALAGAVRRQVPRDDEWRAISYRVFELPGGPGTFAARAERIRAIVDRAAWAPLAAVEQVRIADRAALSARLDEVLRAGGEGLMLHRADAPYFAGRSDALLKLKAVHDADAVVVGHVPGRGRLEGRMGALRVRDGQGAVFLIGSGFDDATRADPPALGRTVTFSYRGRTAAGLPRFASFLRVRSDV